MSHDLKRSDKLELVERIREIHEEIRDRVLDICEQQSLEQLAAVVDTEVGDTIYAIDKVAEQAVRHRFEALAEEWPLVLIAEGLGANGWLTLPRGCSPEDAKLRVIVDPIDGTRCLMYAKRSGWILTGVAPNKGSATTLADVEVAVQTEIPLVKQHLTDSLWAIKGDGAEAERYNRFTRKRLPLVLRPSRETHIAEGFGGVVSPFPGARAELATIADTVVEELLGRPQLNRVLAFEDQYASSGGQLYELMMGHDRWIADLRPLVAPLLQDRGVKLSLCCHPYDLAAELVAREAGVEVTDERGHQLAAPLDTTTNVAWMAFANKVLAEDVSAALRKGLRKVFADRDMASALEEY